MSQPCFDTRAMSCEGHRLPYLMHTYDSTCFTAREPASGRCLDCLASCQILYASIYARLSDIHVLNQGQSKRPGRLHCLAFRSWRRPCEPCKLANTWVNMCWYLTTFRGSQYTCISPANRLLVSSHRRPWRDRAGNGSLDAQIWCQEFHLRLAERIGQAKIPGGGDAAQGPGSPCLCVQV